MFPVNSTSPTPSCGPLWAGSAPDLRYGSSPSPCSTPLLRSPRHNAKSVTPTSSPAQTKSSIKCYRRQRRAGSDGPLIGRRALLTYSPGSPSRNRKDSLWNDEFPRTEFRRRVSTMPSASGSCHSCYGEFPDSDGYYRLRSFSVTSKGIVHLGDLFRQKSKSSASLGSEGSSSTTERDFRDRTSSTGSTRIECPTYRVLLIGSHGVGKSSLISQFMTSDNLLPYDDDPDTVGDDNNEKAVSVLLESEESMLSFLDQDGGSMQINEVILDGIDAVAIVYSVVDRESFWCATKALDKIRRIEDKCRITGRYDHLPRAVILVGNKADLVRCRAVTSEEAKALANKFSNKFIETSAVIGHNVNELLVGILSQIRLQHKQALNRKSSKHAGLATKARGLMHRLLLKCEVRARSCENLHVL